MNDAYDLGTTIGNLSKRISTLEGNVYPDDPSAQLLLQDAETITMDLSGSVFTKNIQSNSFVPDHVVYGNLDSSTLLIDGGYEWQNLSIGLTAYWLLESGVTDTLNGYGGSASNVTYSAGVSGSCAVFNGTTSQATVGTTSLLFPSNNAWTFSIWANDTGFVGGKRVVMFLQDATQLAVGLDDNSGGLPNKGGMNVRYRDSGGTTQVFVGVSNTNLSHGAWYHYALSYDGTTFRFYWSGALHASMVDDFIGFSSTGTMQLAHLNGSDLLNGKIDEIATWNRVLSDGEIAALYNAGAGRFYPLNTADRTLNQTF